MPLTCALISHFGTSYWIAQKSRGDRPITLEPATRGAITMCWERWDPCQSMCRKTMWKLTLLRPLGLFFVFVLLFWKSQTCAIDEGSCTRHLTIQLTVRTTPRQQTWTQVMAATRAVFPAVNGSFEEKEVVNYTHACDGKIICLFVMHITDDCNAFRWWCSSEVWPLRPVLRVRAGPFLVMPLKWRRQYPDRFVFVQPAPTQSLAATNC